MPTAMDIVADGDQAGAIIVRGQAAVMVSMSVIAVREDIFLAGMALRIAAGSIGTTIQPILMSAVNP